MMAVLSNTPNIISEAAITTCAILCCLGLTAIFATAGYYLAEPLGYLILYGMMITFGQKRLPTRKESRVLGSIIIGLFVLITLLFKMFEPDLADQASTIWGSQLMGFVWSLYLDAGIRSIVMVGMLSAFVVVGSRGLCWVGLS